MDQLLGEQHAASLRNRDRRRSDVLTKEPPQVPLANLEPIGQRCDIATIESAAFDQLERRDTVADVPRHASRSGELSGRQRRHGRNPASCAAAAVGTNVQFSSFGGRAGQIGRQ